MSAPTRVIFARVPARLHEKVAAIAGANEVRISKVVELALTDWTERVGPGAKIALRVDPPLQTP